MPNGRRRILQGLVFLTFFPYPAVVQLGNTFGVQISNLIAPIIILLALPMVLAARSTRAYVVLVIPMLVSLAALAYLSGRGDTGVAIRTTASAMIGLLILPAVGALMRQARIQWLVTPVSLAICIHALVGVWQYLVFPGGVFPLRAIFQNASFANLQTITTSYALYVTRPFGLFPEPSAMAAAVGPWVLFLLWYGLRPSVQGRKKALFGCSAGTVLILLSQSIYAVFLLPGGFLILLFHRRTSTRKTSVLEVLAWALAAVGAVMFPILSAGRIDFNTNHSTQGRLTSLMEGISQAFNSSLTVLVGVGPGQSGNAVAAQAGGVTAIYSVVVMVFAEGGLIALIAMIYVGRMCLAGRRHGYAYVFMFAWVAGIAFSTSYISLCSIWVFLGMMLDLEFENEDHPHHSDFMPRRGGTALNVSSNSAIQRQ
jgi:hypothetical protein